MPPLDDLPDLGLIPVDNAAPLMYQTVGLGGGIGTVNLHLVVLGPPGALLTAFTGDDQDFYVFCQRVNV